MLRTLALLALPIAEIWALIAVGGWLGVLNTLLLLIGLSLAGIWLLRKGLSGFAQSTVEGLTQGQGVVPTDVADHALRILGALLLFLPGFVTGAFGLALQLKPLRSAAIAFLGSRLNVVVAPLVRQRSRFGTVDVIDVDGFESGQRSDSPERPSAELPHPTPDA